MWGQEDSNLRSRNNRFTVCPIWPLWYIPILKRAEEKYVTFQISFTDMMFRVYECSDQLFAEYDLNKLNYKNDWGFAWVQKLFRICVSDTLGVLCAAGANLRGFLLNLYA